MERAIVIAESFIKRQCSLLVLVATVALCASCSDETAEPQQTAEQRSVVRETANRERIWLDLHDGTDPSVWLASREAGRDLDEHDPAVVRADTILDGASPHFMETQRMIANRAVQLSAMLAAINVRETPTELVQRIDGIQSKVGGKGYFGDLCQHYFNIRSQGIGADAAVATLTAKAGGVQ